MQLPPRGLSLFGYVCPDKNLLCYCNQKVAGDSGGRLAPL